MAMLIYIKKRSDPIEVSYDRGVKIKELWLSEGTPRDTVIDLGEWAGEIREIKAVAGSKPEKSDGMKPVDALDQDEARYKEEIEKFRALPADKKAKSKDGEILRSYRMSYKFDTDSEPSEKLIEEVRMFVREYFIQNPEALDVPRDLIKSIR